MPEALSSAPGDPFTVSMCAPTTRVAPDSPGFTAMTFAEWIAAPSPSWAMNSWSTGS